MQQVHDYFTSLSSISKRILSDYNYLKDSYGEEWNTFSEEEQEEIFNKFIIDPNVEDKYKSKQVSDVTDDLQEVFPKLKIDCGEKIVVDFENDDVCIWFIIHIHLQIMFAKYPLFRVFYFTVSYI